VVVADSRYLAEDALELIEVEYEPLPPVTDPERALDAGSPLVHEALESNCAYERSFDFGDVERDFAEADVVIRDRLRWHRSGGQPLETVGAIAEYDQGTGSFTIDTNTLSFTSYLFMAAGTLKVPVNKLDIRPVPAGGSFGSKLFANKPAVIAGMCARKTGRRVAYLEDRSDNIANCDHHGSDRVYDVELAMMRDGTMRGLKIDVVDDYGAYIQFGVGHHGNALGPGGRAVHHRQRALPGPGGADQQEPAGRLPGLRLRGEQLDARADGGQGRARARPGPGRGPPDELHQGLPALHPDRQRLRLRRLRAGARPCPGAGPV
jgi:CO/xanthine dehydrogenase Mo-binding subunit